MQFHRDGYQAGDPSILPEHPSVEQRGEGLPDEVDVLIVGCGPAGLVLAAQLAAFPEIRTAVVDRRDGPLRVGQADGVACRTVEMFEAFGLARHLLDEAYWVNEVAFWRPDPADPDRIVRTDRVLDTEEGLSEFPHLIVNQARMLAHLRSVMERSPSRLHPHYGLHVEEVDVDADGATVTLRRLDGGDATVRARYVVGCDGARSAVRRAIGRELVGDATDERWGVMDVLAVTDFPDIRLKCAISSSKGSLLIIPREGGYLVRIYTELDEDAGDVELEDLVATANRVLHPYAIEVRDVGWWSVYEIGQRLCDRFDDVPADEADTRLPRVFIAGDACHTHSAKAGQGMNVSMADAFNLGWKLAAVLRGHARPELLRTYSDERQAVAQELIDFDRAFSKLFSRRAEDVDPAEFQRYFVAQGRFTAGVATRYAPSLVTAADARQELAEGLRVGMRFHSAPAIRLADAKPMQLGHAARADGAWRLWLFADREGPSGARFAELCRFLGSGGSPVARATPAGGEPDAVIDVRAVFQQGHRELDVAALPDVLLPRKGRFGLVDYEKAFCPDPARGDVFDLRGIDRDAGCVVVARPDQHVAHVLPLDAHDELAAFLGAVLLDADPAAVRA
jgi:phenol 2-monooxygenase (NADPH)